MRDIDDVVLASAGTPADNYGEQQLVDQVRSGIAQLPLGKRQVVTLVHL